VTGEQPPQPEDWLRRMRAWGIRPARSKGQNFLLDVEVVERIADAAGIGPDDQVLEIGPGLGILSEALLRRGAAVTAIELDDRLAPRLETHFGAEQRFRLIHGDATAIDPSDIFQPGQAYRIVANLPYGVATVIIRHYLESAQPPDTLIVMVQKEVAERMTATQGDLSLLTLAIQLYTEPEYLFTVPKEAFHTAPKVTSAVVRLRVREDIPIDGPARDRLFSLATIAFQQKRKTLLNSLSRGFDNDKAEVSTWLDAIGIDGSERPQALSFDDWLRLASAESVP
jgi:16S rRNA (adenine1518-N6/adenine1519-N6)-dimethyltransferase